MQIDPKKFTHLRQRGQDGFPVGADSYLKAAYGKIPDSLRFQNQSYGYEEATQIHGWQWSVTFGRWSALVTMPCGWQGFSVPEMAFAPMTDDETYELLKAEIKATNNGKLLLANVPRALFPGLTPLINQGRLARATFVQPSDAIVLGSSNG